MKRLAAALLWCGLAVHAESGAGVLAPRADEPGPERVVLHTLAGDLRVALYPNAAPRTVERFLVRVRGGVFDGTAFARVQPGYFIQLVDPRDRNKPLSEEQQALLGRIPLEASALLHVRGALSMAHDPDDPDSGDTSFCILLAPAPQLDGKYTVFGKVEEGDAVLDELVKVPRDARLHPAIRLELQRADVPQLFGPPLAPARRVPGLSGSFVPATTPATTPPTGGSLATAALSTSVAAGLLLMVLLGVAGFLLRGRAAPRLLLSLNLAGVLVGAFLLFVLLVPEGHRRPWLATVLFFALVGVFKLMGRFETAAEPPRSSPRPANRE